MSVSVILPVWDECPWETNAAIQSAVQSVALYGSGEIIVVDDGSVKPVRVDHSPYVRVYRREHRGLGSSLNYGISKAECRYVAWLSVCFRYHVEKLNSQCRWMDQLGYEATFHDYQIDGTPVKVQPNWRDRLETDNQFCGATAVVTTEVAKKRKFDEELRWCLDWDWACRIEFEGPGWQHLPAVWATAHDHPTGITALSLANEEMKRAKGKDRAKVAKRWRGKSIK